MINKLEFDPGFAQTLKNLATNFISEYHAINSNNISILENQFFDLLKDDFANQIRNDFFKKGFCVIENTPVDDVESINTPMSDEINTPAHLASIVLTCLFQVIGFKLACGISHVRKGALFHDIVPTSQADGIATVNDAAWARDLGFHQEMAFMNRPGTVCSPNALGLLCLRGGDGKRPKTYFVSANQVLSSLEHRCVEVLQMPIFLVSAPFFIPWNVSPQPLYYLNTVDDEFSLTYSSLYTGEKPTISVSEKACIDIGVSFDEANMHLKSLNEAYERVEPYSIIFGKGDCVLLDNRHIQHGRSSFVPKSQERSKMRWLLRSYAMPREHVPDDRIIKCYSSF